jgi:hypothetical protein
MKMMELIAIRTNGETMISGFALNSDIANCPMPEIDRPVEMSDT